MSSTGRPDTRPSIGELVGSLTEKLSRLIRDEISLAKAEMAQKAKHAGVGAGLLAGAALLGFFALATLIATAVLGLAEVLAPWLAALIVTLVLLTITGILALVGVKALKKGVPPVPERAQSSLRSDVEAVKEGLQR
ncbi:phage holin family protein [Cellulomonas bogoriensis]|uniref:Phage holin family protein n=1 Tax=Cellulomonas bogoriensis 69B4 = DSM 16987 TaxID=1386082 RepID=A0A0A0C4A3_9CELL|nr:phage holin family protein [Cellulomonas bogoriensis]KGM14189.1 hypothetical protein N869_02930 [Cellulomonas bogoriensis 69B4 = DSM 16987]